MKVTLYLKIAAVIVMASASSLLAGTIGTAQNFEFQWDTTDTGFSPTYLMITAVLGAPTDASTAITGFQITTPNGVWTPSGFTPTGGNSTSAPFWLDDSSLTVSGTTADPVLTFGQSGATLETAGVPTYQVILETDSIMGSQLFFPNDAGGTSMGTWDAVTLDASAPEVSNTLVLLAIGAIALCAGSRLQRVRAES